MMASRRRIIGTRIAIGFVLTISALFPTGARAQGFGDYPVIYRPAKGAKDLRSVLFNWTWYMGMLRGVDEHEPVSYTHLDVYKRQVQFIRSENGLLLNDGLSFHYFGSVAGDTMPGWPRRTRQ